MKKIVIALDSFKGCLTSAEAGEAAAQGVHAACPECQTIVLPVADGGEGMLDSVRLLKIDRELRPVSAIGNLNTPRK